MKKTLAFLIYLAACVRDAYVETKRAWNKS